MEPIHRDDIDADQMAAIEAQFAEMFPGMKVVCAGDVPGELPPDVKDALAAIEQRHMESIVHGQCIDCGAKMPDYDLDRDDWQPTKGWRHFTDAAGELVAWQCPACDQNESES